MVVVGSPFSAALMTANSGVSLSRKGVADRRIAVALERRQQVRKYSMSRR
jgi:zona occludens toxin (predicted ATPase)